MNGTAVDTNRLYLNLPPNGERKHARLPVDPKNRLGRGLHVIGGIRQRDRNAIHARYDLAQTTVDNQKHWAQADYYDADSANNRWTRGLMVRRSRYETANNGYVDGITRKLYVNLLYELFDHFAAGSDKPTGLTLSAVPGAVLGERRGMGLKIVKAWDPDLLSQARVYEGILEVPFRLLEIPVSESSP